MQIVHALLARARRHFARDRNTHTARFYRILNEVPAVAHRGYCHYDHRASAILTGARMQTLSAYDSRVRFCPVEGRSIYFSIIIVRLWSGEIFLRARP